MRQHCPGANMCETVIIESFRFVNIAAILLFFFLAEDLDFMVLIMMPKLHFVTLFISLIS